MKILRSKVLVGTAALVGSFVLGWFLSPTTERDVIGKESQNTLIVQSHRRELGQYFSRRFPEKIANDLIFNFDLLKNDGADETRRQVVVSNLLTDLAYLHVISLNDGGDYCKSLKKRIVYGIRMGYIKAMGLVDVMGDVEVYDPYQTDRLISVDLPKLVDGVKIQTDEEVVFEKFYRDVWQE